MIRQLDYIQFLTILNNAEIHIFMLCFFFYINNINSK